MYPLMRRRMMISGNAIPKEPSYLTFTANTDGSTVKLTQSGTAFTVNLEISVDDGNTWQGYTIGDTITLANIGDSVLFRGNNTTIALSTSRYCSFVMTGSISASGDITSLLNKTGGDVPLSGAGFIYLFRNCSQMTTPPNLPSTSLVSYGYYSLFYQCYSLSIAPVLPAAVVPRECYRYIFRSDSLINYVETYMTNITAKNAISNWLYGVAPTGELKCKSSLSLPSGASGLPSGWTRTNI